MSKRQTRRERQRKQKQRQRMITMLVIAGVALIVAGLLVLPNLKPVGEVVQPPAREHPMANDNAMGDPNAPVVIEEFSDFQCPYCRLFYENTEEALIQAYVATGKVYFVYHSMGGMIGPESLAAAEAAYCAGDQGKFWEYHDILFANQTGENVGAFSTKRLVAFADALNLDVKAFKDCLNGHKYRQRATQDQVDGRQKGIRATPSFLINGKLLEGAQPFEVFQQAIEEALTASGG